MYVHDASSFSTHISPVKILQPEENGSCFAGNHFKHIMIKNSMKLVVMSQIVHTSS